MRNQLDFDKILSAAEIEGYSQCEIYAEASHLYEMGASHGMRQARPSYSQGASLRAKRGEETLFLSMPLLDTQAWIEALKQKTSASPSTWNVPNKPIAPCPIPRTERTRLLHRLDKEGWPDSPALQWPEWRYQEKQTQFEVAQLHGQRALGSEEHALLEVSWHAHGQRFEKQLARNRVESLLMEWEHCHPFRKAVDTSLKIDSAWPTPKGTLPVVWSSRAVSKLCQALLHGFEGDVFLSNGTFLASTPLPLPFRFSLAERPAKLTFDHEGSPRKRAMIFDRGQPRLLACDMEIASQLNVRSTGHCRRAHFHDAPTIGFWHPEVLPKATHEMLLEDIQGGLWVGDLDVANFHAKKATADLRLSELFLIHNGEIGESVQPITFETNVIELLSFLDVFSKEKQTTGLIRHKDAQELVTEITAPAALSTRFSVPGSVPASHYW